MENFDFISPTKFVFGKDTEQRIGELAKPYGKKALLHFGGTSAERSGLLGRVEKSLNDAGIETSAGSGSHHTGCGK